MTDGSKEHSEMIEFRKFSEFPRGTMYDILRDAYSFDARNQQIWDENWRGSDDFFYDNPDIADIDVLQINFGDLTGQRGDHDPACAVGKIGQTAAHSPAAEAVDGDINRMASLKLGLENIGQIFL